MQQARRKLIPEMEGPVARWYARQRGSASQLAEYRQQAVQLTEDLPDGAEVLEVAPGPGYLAVEIARLGRVRVTGLDISRTFVQLASEYADRAGVRVEFRQGSADALPFAADSFDRVVCQAAFKNFVRPVQALDEMHRVLRPGGVAVIQDMCKDATRADIAAEVRRMRLTPLNALMVRNTLGWLRRRAYTRAQFERLAGESAFRTAEVRTERIGIEVRLTKPFPSGELSQSAG
jgi:ubiquinone/menaquinone biosynthesis C-methylase UbiE